MAAFLFVAASVALLAGLVGLVARHVPRTTGRKGAKKGLHPSIASWSRGRMNAGEHYQAWALALKGGNPAMRNAL
jgi:hypothetical protein